jgi:NitT/TauT family transport system substrate-binding protein
MIAPLGAGQLDVGGGAAASGLYNAVERGIDIRIVADKARNENGFQSFLIRKALVDSGQVKGVAELKGRKVAIVAAASTDASRLNDALQSAGLHFGDVDVTYLGFPQQPAAFQNGAIDASVTSEPYVTYITRAGLAVRLEPEPFFPRAQTAVILYGGEFAKKRADVARKFMKAYLRAVRDYNDALKGGKIAGKDADEIVAILAKYANLKDTEVIRNLGANGCDPDGNVNVESLKRDLEFFKAQGQVKGTTAVEQVLDRSFAEAAVKELGPYRRGGS